MLTLECEYHQQLCHTFKRPFLNTYLHKESGLRIVKQNKWGLFAIFTYILDEAPLRKM